MHVQPRLLRRGKSPARTIEVLPTPESPTNNVTGYVVKWVGYKWICSCPDYVKHSEEIDYACKHIEAMFKAVRKIGWSRDGIEVEVVRRHKQFNGNGRNGRNAEEETP